MRKLADWVVLADGWARATTAIASGAVGALAMPPFGAWPALVVSLTVAVWLIDGSSAGRRIPAVASAWRAASAGWLWGFGYFVASLWWIGSAFLVQADLFAWLMPFGVLGLPAVLAVFPALGFAVARLLWSRNGARLFALSFGLTASEWLRGHAFTGFPWNTLGLAFGQNLWLMQSASVVGMYGLTVMAVLICAAPATIATGASPTSRLRPSLLAMLALLAMAGFGAVRLSGGDIPSVAGVRLRIVQPNLPQDEKFNSANGAAILRHYLELSDRATSPEAGGIAGVTHLIWPESAFPFLLHREPVALAQIARALPSGAVLLTGAARSDEGLREGERTRYYNSIQVVATDGGIASSYDKVHLVPFGEYVPEFLDTALRALGIRQFVSIPGGFTPGSRRAVLDAPGLPPAAGSVLLRGHFPGRDDARRGSARPDPERHQ